MMQYIVKAWHIERRNNDPRSYRRPAGQLHCFNYDEALAIAEAIDGVTHTERDVEYTTEARVMTRVRLPFDCGGTLTIPPNELRNLMNEIGHAVDQYEQRKVNY